MALTRNQSPKTAPWWIIFLQLRKWSIWVISTSLSVVFNNFNYPLYIFTGVIFYLIACFGFLVVWMSSPAPKELLALIYFGGISSSFLYTGGLGLKYIAMGDIIIMITFGPVSVLYSFISQTGKFICVIYVCVLIVPIGIFFRNISSGDHSIRYSFSIKCRGHNALEQHPRRGRW